MKRKQFDLTRSESLRLLDRITDHDDPYWSDIVEDHYDEATDSMPSIYDLLRGLGVTKAEYMEAHPGVNVRPEDWPDLGLAVGSVVMMHSESGMKGYGNAQCVSSVCEPLGTIGLYGHNEHYKISHVSQILI